ncbi:cell division protein FtsL [Pseudooceanicola sp. HF7]|uniref:cell division protein FtsL n=1 Tax=Pseudooceanicola sp. HF7 TaxID=2721560 RepID=UPI00142F8443|nr:cell division protein FtsL [Pseudooceanicola sp. HF7]NIZ11218.1 cell division protein FtsL [Pseudooceanicola sp. HF7]
MRSVLFVVSAIALIGLAFWAYRENYDTKAAINQAEDLQDEIAAARARLSMLRAEWAYLNRPDRLRALAEANFGPLGLQPLDAAQFGVVAQVRFPPAETLRAINRSIEVSSLNQRALLEALNSEVGQ